jgi:hypothetical protein
MIVSNSPAERGIGFHSRSWNWGRVTMAGEQTRPGFGARSMINAMFGHSIRTNVTFAQNELFVW